MEKRQATSNMLRALADAMDRLSDKEFEAVLNMSGLMSLSSVSGGKRRVNRQNKSRGDHQSEAEALIADLSRAKSREEARSYLDSRQPTRSALLAAAKSRSVYIAKEDNIFTIAEKLIANTVGSRLDSEAIQNS